MHTVHARRRISSTLFSSKVEKSLTFRAATDPVSQSDCVMQIHASALSNENAFVIQPGKNTRIRQKAPHQSTDGGGVQEA